MIERDERRRVWARGWFGRLGALLVAVGAFGGVLVAIGAGNWYAAAGWSVGCLQASARLVEAATLWVELRK